MKINIGIYKIENTITKDIYIGQSINLTARKRQHFNSLKENRHRNRYLQRAFNKYGKDSFTFTVLLYCEKFELTRYEQALVNILDPSYNICKECIDSSKGIIRSPEFLAKMYGHSVSEETREKIASSLRGKPSWNAGKKGLQTAWNKGLKMSKQSEETKQKKSKSLQGHRSWSKGKKWTDEQKEKLKVRVPWNKGIKTGNLSEITKQRMASSQKERREREASNAVITAL